MADIWKSISDHLSAFRERWVVYSTLGTAALYVVGYLITRFQLTVLGVATNLDIVKEQYFYTGARFAVYLLATLPSLLILLLPLAALLWLVVILVRAAAGPQRKAHLAQRWSAFLNWWLHPIRVRLTGIIFSVAAIQFILRECFVLHDLLLGNAPHRPRWLLVLLLDLSDTFTPVFFAGLVAMGLITFALFCAVRARPAEGAVAQSLEVLFALLAAVQLLLVPVNYAYLIAPKWLPRVVPPDTLKVGPEQGTWLVWSDDQRGTFLVANKTNLLQGRFLATIPAKDFERLQITGYDSVLNMMFGDYLKTNRPPVP